jgi:hypothetical protein
MDRPAPDRGRAGGVPDRIPRLARRGRHHRAGAAAVVRDRRADRARVHRWPLRACLRDRRRLPRRRAQLLDRTPLGPAAARALAVHPLPRHARAGRDPVPSPWRQGHPGRALRRRGAAVRARDRRHAAHAAAPLRADQPVRGGPVGGLVPGAGLDLRRLLRSRGRSRRPAGTGAGGAGAAARGGVVGGGLRLALVRRARQRHARAAARLDPRASAAGPLCGGTGRPQPPGIAVAAGAGGGAAGDRLGLVRHCCSWSWPAASRWPWTCG